MDVLALKPAGQVLAIEVKGTVRAGSLQRLGRARERQMSHAWLSTSANPGMAEWGLAGADVYGAVAHVDFGSGSWRRLSRSS